MKAALMSESNNIAKESAVPGDGLSAIRQLYVEVSEALQNTSDLQQAFDSVTRLANGLRELADSAALTRAKVAAQIREDEGLSVAALGAKLGMSKARADQLLNAARNG